jgi:hypothetical protein
MHKHRKIFITKASGRKVPFSEEHLRKSLSHSGAPGNVINNIVEEVAAGVYEGMPTEIIHEKVFNELKERPNASAARYKLKKALMELGPTGYPFEKFMARVFDSMGYVTRTGEIMEGLCVTHEVDVTARTDREFVIMECKYHNRPGFRCDVKVPLYISARFWDIEKYMRQDAKHDHVSFQGWVATNVHFTEDAIQYGQCAGLRLIGWDYPKQVGLKDLIDNRGLYPITSMTTLTETEKQQLLEKGLVMCTDIVHHQETVNKIISSDTRMNKILAECDALRPTTSLLPGSSGQSE